VLVVEADKAVIDLATAQQALKDFREVGARKALFDHANAVRKATYGALGQIAHSHPEAKLPSDFADRFFLHDSRPRKKAPTLEELKERLAAAQAAVDAMEAQTLAASQAEAKAKAAAAAQDLAAAEKEAA